MGIGFSVVAAYFVWKNTEKIEQQQLEIAANDVKSKIQSRLDAYIQFSQSSSAFFMASDTITREDWKFFVEKSKVSKSLKGFQGVVYILKVPKAQLENHNKRFKAEFNTNYAIYPESVSEVYTPITFIEPLAGRNLKALGFNISSNPKMREALQESRDLNTAILTNKVTLIQEGSSNGQPGIVIYSPIFKRDAAIKTISERRKAVTGWAAISFRVNDFLEGVMDQYNLANDDNVQLKIYDGDNLSSEFLLYNSEVNYNAVDNAVNTLVAAIEFNNKTWTFQFKQPKVSFFQTIAFLALIAGFIISLLLSFLVFSLSNTANLGKRIAENLTLDLSKKNEELIVAKEAAEESEEQLKLISNNLANGMIYQVISINETERKFTYVSDNVKQLYGCTVEQAKENSNLIYGRIHPEDVLKVQEKEKIAIENMSVLKLEARILNPDNSIRWSYFSSKPRLFKGEICWDGIEIDITEQKKIENELIVSKGKAEESNRLKTEFLNNMSHEIRTPMNGILGFTDFLLNPDLSEAKRKNYIQIVQSSGQQLLHIIDDIIEISRLGTKQVRFVESEVCLNDLLLELFSVFDIKAKENKIPLYIKNNLSNAESTILSDKSKLNKILSNLLENSLKFTNEGFVEIGYTLINKELEIYIKDTGVGIDEEKHEQIFERFAQAEMELSKKTGGLGLGLSIVKENVELIGGQIRLESKKGIGTTFFITIPYKKVHSINNEENSKTVIEDKYTILIAEDEEVNYLFLETLINDVLKLNCNILHAKNGKEAINYCVTDKTIKLVLMDLKMPVMSGFEAVVEIKKIYPELIVVAQSAYSSVDEINKAMSLGFNDFISKPISVESFKSMLKKHLQEII